MRLEATRTVRLRPRPPFAFDPSLHKPDHFPSADNEWRPGVRWQTMLWRGEPLGLKLEAPGSVDRPAIELAVWSRRELPDAFVESLARELAHRLSLDLDLAGFYAKVAADPHLGPIVERWRGMRPLNVSSLWGFRAGEAEWLRPLIRL